MPTIALFGGVAIRMWYNDHPPPHFHAVYGRMEAKFTLDGKVVAGRLPPAQVKLVQRWVLKYRSELVAAWASVRAEREPEAIPGP